MLTISKYKNIFWYHFQNSITSKDFDLLKKKYNIDDYIQKKFINDLNRDKALLINNNILFTLTIPDLKNNEYDSQILKFIIGKDYFISYSLVKNEGIEKFKLAFEKNANFGKDETKKNPLVHILLHMFEKIYENMLFELQEIEKEMDEIENNIFQENQLKMVKKISAVNHKLIDFRKNLKTHDDSWKIFLDLSQTFFPKISSRFTLEGIVLSYQRVLSQAEQLKETLWELRDTNNSLLNANLGETSKTFTLIAFLNLPISLFVSIISIPTKQGHIFLGHENDFNLIVITSVILLIIMIIISKLKKWW